MFGTTRQKTQHPQRPDERAKWQSQRGLLNMRTDKTSDVLAFIAECDAADLHQFHTVMGVQAEIEIFYAVINHPACDRATALNIFTACDPAYYDHAFAKGIRPEAFRDEEDQVFLAIAVAAHAALTSDRVWTSRFPIHAAPDWDRLPHAQPTQYRYLRLPKRAIAPTKNETPQSMIVVENGEIGLSFAAWKRQN